jgi:uncharacterized protein YjdB
MGVYTNKASSSKGTISLDKSSITMMNIQNATLTPEVLNSEGQENITWTSSDETVAVVKNGKVMPLGGGTAIITAALDNGETANMPSYSNRASRCSNKGLLI